MDDMKADGEGNEPETWLKMKKKVRHGAQDASRDIQPPDAFALATIIAFGSLVRPASAAAYPYAVHHSSHNDLTPLRGYREFIGFASLSMPPRT